MIVYIKEIADDIELKLAVEAVGNGLQFINDYLTENPKKAGKVRFPRKFIGDVSTHNKKYNWVENDTLKRNLSYQYIFYDVLRWIANRTDIYGIAREMLYKHAIVVISSIAEGLLAAAAIELNYKEKKFPSRLKHLLLDGILDQKLHDGLLSMWKTRHAIHIHIVDDLEWDKYKADNINDASEWVRNFENALREHFA